MQKFCLHSFMAVTAHPSGCRKDFRKYGERRPGQLTVLFTDGKEAVCGVRCEGHAPDVSATKAGIKSL